MNAPKGAAIVYLHGGGYCLGSPLSHRALTARLAVAASREAVVIDYPLAPEHPFPAAIDHALAAWEGSARRRTGSATRRLRRGQRRRRAHLRSRLGGEAGRRPSAAGLVAISPWVDLAQTGRAYEAGAVDDPMITKAGLDAMRAITSRAPVRTIRWPRRSTATWPACRRPCSRSGRKKGFSRTQRPWRKPWVCRSGRHAADMAGDGPRLALLRASARRGA